MTAGTQLAPRSADTGERRRLLWPLTALLVAEVFHIGATVANGGEPSAPSAQAGPLAHIGTVLFTIGLIIWTRRGGPHSRELTAATGAAVAVAAVLYHLLPVDSDFTNHFGGDATVAQHVSVYIGIVAGTWCTVRGLRVRPRRRRDVT